MNYFLIFGVLTAAVSAYFMQPANLIVFGDQVHQQQAAVWFGLAATVAPIIRELPKLGHRMTRRKPRAPVSMLTLEPREPRG